MLGQLIRIAAELAIVAMVVLGSIVVARRSGRERDPARLTAAVLAAGLAVSAAVHAVDAARLMNHARRNSVTATAGLEHCFTESVTGGPFVAERDAFMQWVKRRLPPEASYTVTPYAGPPDAWCLTTALLPALPAGADTAPDFTIVAGAPVPPAVAAAIARHAAGIESFAPDYALVRGTP